MPQRILLIQSDPACLELIFETRNNSSDAASEVGCVRLCSERLENLINTTATLLDVGLSDSCGTETLDRLLRFVSPISIVAPCRSEHEEPRKLAAQRAAKDHLYKNLLDDNLLPKIVPSIQSAPYAESLPEREACAQIAFKSIGDPAMTSDVSGNVTYLNSITENCRMHAEAGGIAVARGGVQKCPPLHCHLTLSG